MHDMKQVTGIEVDEATVCSFLKKFSRKKLQQVALQRSAELQSEFLSDCSVYNPEMLVFLDETGCDRCSSLRKFGYSLVGKCAPSTSLLVRGVRYSAIGILTVEGIQDSYITYQNIDAEKFEDFVDKCLVPRLTPFNGIHPNSVVILDNASIHHVDHIVHLYIMSIT